MYNFPSGISIQVNKYWFHHSSSSYFLFIGYFVSVNIVTQWVCLTAPGFDPEHDLLNAHVSQVSVWDFSAYLPPTKTPVCGLA